MIRHRSDLFQTAFSLSVKKADILDPRLPGGDQAAEFSGTTKVIAKGMTSIVSFEASKTSPSIA